ncbi:hypothetical protein [Spirillospora albida]|uniref:hypothetical protein n=1 Tax=Spirillospora albida TaxID=58123 RepID=UPI0012F9A8A9|nr:hypothetical protein [Spirillospora albida]
MTNITPLDYALYVLYTMRDAPPDRVESALRQAGVDQSRLQHSYSLVNKQNFTMKAAFADKSKILAPAIWEGVREIHGRECFMRSFRLPIWNDFLLDIYATPEGRVWDERFTRASESSTTIVTRPEALEPWSVTMEEVDAQFGPLRVEERWPPYESFSMEFSEDEGNISKYEVIFSWGLLQKVDYEGTVLA